MVKGHQVHFIVAGFKGNFGIYVHLAKEGANPFIDISKKYWTECSKFKKHSGPIWSHKGGQKVTKIVR